MTLCVGSSAVSSDTYGPEDEYVKNSSYGCSAVTVADIVSLMGDLNEAILLDDINAENEILDEFARSGVIPITYSEVLKLTGAEAAPYVSDVNINFNTVYSEIQSYFFHKNHRLFKIAFYTEGMFLHIIQRCNHLPSVTSRFYIPLGNHSLGNFLLEHHSQWYFGFRRVHQVHRTKGHRHCNQQFYIEYHYTSPSAGNLTVAHCLGYDQI